MVKVVAVQVRIHTEKPSEERPDRIAEVLGERRTYWQNIETPMNAEL